MEGVFTAKMVLFHQGSTELRRFENCVFFIPVNILRGVAHRLLGPHDTLPCVLIYIYIYISNPKQPSCKKKCAALRKAMLKKDVKSKVAAKNWL